MLSGATAMTLPRGLDWNSIAIRDDTCDDDFTGTDRYDCDKPAGHTLNADGSCGNGISPDPDQECKIYCEIRRTGWVGDMQTAPGKFGELQAKGTSINLEEGTEVSITTGFSVGLDGTMEEVFSLGASFECTQYTYLTSSPPHCIVTDKSCAGSVSVTKTTSIQRNGESSDDYHSKWVLWPKMVTTCGSLTSYDYSPGASGGDGSSFATPACFVNTASTVGNVCTTTPFLNSDGEVESFWATGKSRTSGVPRYCSKRTERALYAS